MTDQQAKACEDFARELVLIGKQREDNRGELFRAVAAYLSHHDQNFTAQLVRHVADVYERA